MKKLLFVGALLVLGATSFGGVSGIFTDSSGGVTGSSLSAEATLNLGAKGNVIDSTGRAVLVVTPIGTEGADGEALTFNFGDVMTNSTQTLIGRFTAEIIADNKNLAFPNGQPTVELKTKGEATGSPDPNKGNFISGIEVVEVGTSTQVGTLSYNLSGTMTSKEKYTGTVTATFKSEESATGTFNDKSAEVSVAVSGLNYTGSSLP